MSKIPVPEYAINATGLTEERARIIGLQAEVAYYRAIAENIAAGYEHVLSLVGRIQAGMSADRDGIGYSSSIEGAGARLVKQFPDLAEMRNVMRAAGEKLLCRVVVAPGVTCACLAGHGGKHWSPLMDGASK